MSGLREPAFQEDAATKPWLLPPLEHAPQSGCFSCPPKPLKVPLRYNPHPGFGLVTLERDGQTVESQIHYEKSTTFIRFENVAMKDPDHDWRVISNGPLSDVTWQRHGPKAWLAVKRGRGFA